MPVPVEQAQCNCEAPATTAYAPPPVEQSCNCEAPSRIPTTETKETWVPKETWAPRQKPYQDRQERQERQMTNYGPAEKD